MAKPIMIQGTMSHVGKSLITAGLCRIFKQDGHKVAPFKSQNMALNSFITKEGLEMGRAQVVQAEAAMVPPDVSMNPILLKPTSDTGSQVIVHGVPVGNMDAREYFKYRKSLVPQIQKAYEKLDQEYDIVVIEGAGSPAEINLKQDDLVNMGMARMAKAPVLLVGDIDRGGVFAQLYGTMALLDQEERAMVKGLVINKFRGDRSILDPGIKMLEDLCGVPVAGVVPYMKVDLEEEDSLSGQLIQGGRPGALVDLAVVRLPRISNFTDFQVFSCLPQVSLRYVDQASCLGNPDMVVIPGTKNTIEDLLWMRQNGLEAAIQKLAAKGALVFGICGGYQMLGISLADPEGVESQAGRQGVAGMGLLPVKTVFEREKARNRAVGRLEGLQGILAGLSGMEVEGYEIHMGRTSPVQKDQPHFLARLWDGPQGFEGSRLDGCCRGNVYGTYIHGFFDKEGIASALAARLMEKKGMAPGQVSAVDYKAYRQQQYGLLAESLRASLPMDNIYQILYNGI